MLYDRMRAVACRYWGIPPWELDSRIEQGGVSFAEVMNLIHLLGHDPLTGPWLFAYLAPATVERIKEKKKAADNKVQFAKILPMVVPKNEEERWFLESLQAQLKEEVSNGA